MVDAIKGISDWATPSLMEVPFWRDGMTSEEYDKEREYYSKHFDLVKKNNMSHYGSRRKSPTRLVL